MRKQLRQIKRSIKHQIYYQDYPFGAILMLHRVNEIDNDRLWYNEHLKLSPYFLDHFMSDAKRKGCTFVSLDEIGEVIRKRRKSRKLIAITLDDGYKDNYTKGLPVFKSNNIPFCIYVATRFVEKDMVYWWYIIEDVIQRNNRISLSNGNTYICGTREEKEQAFLDIREVVLTLPQKTIVDELNNLFEGYSITLDDYKESLALTWDQLRALRDESLATIGCHTHSHYSFAGCADLEIISDVNLSRQLMIEKAGIEMHHFAFPFGDAVAVLPSHLELLKSMGFETSATTFDGLMRHDSDLMRLPRIFVTERNAYNVLQRIIYEC